MQKDPVNKAVAIVNPKIDFQGDFSMRFAIVLKPFPPNPEAALDSASLGFLRLTVLVVSLIVLTFKSNSQETGYQISDTARLQIIEQFGIVPCTLKIHERSGSKQTNVFRLLSIDGSNTHFNLFHQGATNQFIGSFIKESMAPPVLIPSKDPSNTNSIKGGPQTDFLPNTTIPFNFIILDHLWRSNHFCLKTEICSGQRCFVIRTPIESGGYFKTWLLTNNFAVMRFIKYGTNNNELMDFSVRKIERSEEYGVRPVLLRVVDHQKDTTYYIDVDYED